MSSKTQYKDALKRANKLNSELKFENDRLDKENRTLRILNHQFKSQLSQLPKDYKLKKWWQFWK